MVIKLHPYLATTTFDEQVSQSQRVIVLKERCDPYPMLAIADVLVTDYSSVLFDYIVTRRPIVLFAFDLDEYVSRRSFYLDIESIAFGPIARSQAELFAALRRALQSDAPVTYAESEIRRFNRYTQGGASARIADVG